jgi:hypothetical protein
MLKLGFVSAIFGGSDIRGGNIVCVWYGILLRRDYVLACRKGRKTLCWTNAH